MTDSGRSGHSLSLRWFFAFFFISGFCSILYEIIWLRLAMAKFGVTSAMLSIVLSMFMAGLGLGSWASGRLLRSGQSISAGSALRLYAAAELAIGISAWVVPLQFTAARTLIANWALASSSAYYFASGIGIALTLIPWCACMGATIPFAMLAIKKAAPAESERSFSFLYLANVLGAFLGAILPLLLVEAVGFRGTLRTGSALNIALAIAAIILAAKAGQSREIVVQETPHSDFVSNGTGRIAVLALLFATGCSSMGLEVVWTRQFTPYVGTVVYAFASLLALYLGSTFLGSRIYRVWSGKLRPTALLWATLGLYGMLAAFTANPGIPLPRLLRLIIGIVPFSGLLGFVTPMLVDRWSGGDPDRAGTAYAWNIAGCIVGPLLSGFLFLPLMSEHWVLLIFSLPWLVVGLMPGWCSRIGLCREEGFRERMTAYAVVAISLVAAFTGRGFESKFRGTVVLRDPTATVFAVGQGMDKHLVVNGIGVAKMTPITKMMAHLPLASLNRPPQDALVICFGMGATYRSLLSWNIPTTAVELVPSVPKLFWYFQPGAEGLLNSPLSRVVIDDGRAYLERNPAQYDVITIDPPPPVEAAGSSLLYSEEFYATVRQRLRPGGILQQWLPIADASDHAAVARALTESFPYVRVFGSVEGWGVHFLASSEPLPQRNAAELAARLPASAAVDLTEWGPANSAEGNFAIVLSRERPVSEIQALASAPALRDDQPVNEYYALRRYLQPGLRKGWTWVSGRSASAVAPPEH